MFGTLASVEVISQMVCFAFRSLKVFYNTFLNQHERCKSVKQYKSKYFISVFRSASPLMLYKKKD